MLPIKVLDLSASLIDDGSLEVIENFPRLRQLGLSNTNVLGLGLVHLAELKDLEVLLLSDTYLNDSAIDHLPKLERLWTLALWRTRITTAGLPKLERFPKLRNLMVDQDLEFSPAGKALRKVLVKRSLEQ